MHIEIKQTGPLDVNTYILKDFDSKEAVIIDLGGDFESIKKQTDNEGYTIKFILNTHGHFDHVSGEAEVQKKYPQIPVYMHKDDMPHILRLKEEMRCFGYETETDIIKPDKFIDEKSELYIGNNRIEIFHTPGHSKGSISFYICGCLFSGDALFYRSIGRTDFYDGDYDTLVNSVKKKLFTLPDDTKVYPGHGISTSVKDEKKYNTCL